MPRKGRKPKTIIERQGIKCHFIILNRHSPEQQRPAKALPPGICCSGIHTPAELSQFARAFWTGEKWSEDVTEAVNYVITQNSDKEIHDKGLAEAWTLSTMLRPDQATPAQVRAFIHEYNRARETNFGILIMLGHFWVKDITPQEQAEWTAFVEQRAKL